MYFDTESSNMFLLNILLKNNKISSIFLELRTKNFNYF